MKDKQLRKQFEAFKKDVIKVIYDHIQLQPFEYFNQYFMEIAQRDLEWAEKHGEKEISRNCSNGLLYNLDILQIQNETGSVDKVVYKGKEYKIKDKENSNLFIDARGVKFDPSPAGFIPEPIKKAEEDKYFLAWEKKVKSGKIDFNKK